jgi:hypothetical protein
MNDPLTCAIGFSGKAGSVRPLDRLDGIPRNPT